jgi:hypothetical protein
MLMGGQLRLLNLLTPALQNLNRKNLEFEAWDYGTNCSIGAPFQESCNQMKYGSLKPYVYDLSKVTAPQVSYARS